MRIRNRASLNDLVAAAPSALREAALLDQFRELAAAPASRRSLKRNRLDYYGGYSRRVAKEEQNRHFGIISRTARLCSCHMCGNPRRYWKEMTMPERRLADRTRAELDDLMNDETGSRL